jgi:hypothetical protein
MSRKVRRDGSAEQQLNFLLDALANELLEAPDHEVAVTLWDLDPTGRNALKAARRVIIALNDPSESPAASNVIDPRHWAALSRDC